MKWDGYAKDAATLQRIIRRLSEDVASDPDFCERNIQRLKESVSDFTDHAAKRARDRTGSKPNKKGNGVRNAAQA